MASVPSVSTKASVMSSSVTPATVMTVVAPPSSVVELRPVTETRPIMITVAGITREARIAVVETETHLYI